MTPLNQQLEDKKKGCGKALPELDGAWIKNATCGDFEEYCPKCQEIIAILEQAIAEIQKQRQEILDKIDKFEKDNTISIRTKDLVKGKVIISDYIYWGDFRRFKEQLNQPKTENEF